MTAISEPDRKKRPFGVIVIVFLQLFTVFNAVGFFLIVDLIQTGTLDLGITPPQPDAYEVTAAVLDLATLIIVVGMWRLRQWAWTIFMIRLGLDLTIDLMGYLAGSAPYLSMFLSVVTVFYLNQRDVRAMFIAPSTEGPTS